MEIAKFTPILLYEILGGTLTIEIEIHSCQILKIVYFSRKGAKIVEMQRFDALASLCVRLLCQWQNQIFLTNAIILDGTESKFVKRG